MASSFRLVGKSLFRRNFTAAVRTGSPAIPRILAPIRNFSDDAEPVNIVDIAGRVVDDFSAGEVLIHVGWSTEIRVVPGSRALAESMKEIKKDMNVAVTGSLGQKNAIFENDDSKYRLDKVNFVIAKDYKILPLMEAEEKLDNEEEKVSDRETV